MKKYSSLQNLKSFQAQFDTKDADSTSNKSKSKKVSKQFSIEGKIAAMQNTQRASGRRGN